MVGIQTDGTYAIGHVLICFIILGRAGVPMEVMGLMLGQFVDDYTITCVDVFAMPQVCQSNCPANYHPHIYFNMILIAWYGG